MNRHIVLGFDMETDIGSYLKSYKGVKTGTSRVLSILSRAGIRATFFFTGDAAEKNQDVVTEVARAGHEVGCHSLRHETVGDAHFNMPNDSPILEEELEHRLELNVRILERVTGRKPTAFRAPRLWQGDAQVQVLEKLGFLVDASYSVAAHKQMTVPYHPSRKNWLEPGDMRLLEIPNFAFQGNQDRFRRYFGRNDQWPLLRLLGARFVLENLPPVVDEQLSRAPSACLLFYLHPWEFEPMPAKYRYDEGTFLFKPELHENCGDRMTREFSLFVQRALDAGYQFGTCDEYRAFYEAQRGGQG
ncbi:MAG TPA: polysaccharide deacetylase family protein [Spirochaetia bacterium]|nr:polysaccharide deacetylase family protein [Spirochaetia bacterium]